MENCGEDGDTIKLKDDKGEIKLSEIYKGETISTGSYTNNKEKIEELTARVTELERQLQEEQTKVTNTIVALGKIYIPGSSSIINLTASNNFLNEEYVEYINDSYKFKKECKVRVIVYARRYKKR